MDDTTTPATAAAAAASHVLRNAFAELRHAYPFMDTQKLNTILDNVGGQLQEELSAGEQAMATSKGRFDLFKLPAELRNCIYELALARDESVFFEIQHSPATTHWNLQPIPAVKTSAMPPLLQICRQIRAEASPIFFSNTHFVASFSFRDLPTTLVPEWLALFDQNRTKNIKHLTIKFHNSDLRLLQVDILQIVNGARYRNNTVLKRIIKRKSNPVIKADVVQGLGLQKYGVNPDAVVVTYQDLMDGDWQVLEEGT